MIQTTINKKRVNIMTADDCGVGSGFSVGVVNLKNQADGLWYSVQTSGSSPSVSTWVNPSPLPFGSSSYYDTNFPYQIVAGDDGLSYQLYLSASNLVVSQSAYGSASITDVYGAIHDLCKPSLLFQSISDGNYYSANLHTTNNTMSLVVSQNIISSSWIHQ